MIGLGTIINSGSIILGGLLGLLIGKRLTERFQKILITSLGLSVIFLSVSSAIKEILVINENNIETQGTFIIIISLVLGAIIGEAINLEDKTTLFGEWLKYKTKSENENRFVEGFVVSSLTVSVGAMAVIGSIDDAVNHDITILVTKSILDGVFIIVLTTIYGKGCIFSAIPVFIFQGLVTILALLFLSDMSDKAISNLSLVGSILIFCIGINLLFNKKIKVANLLPAIFIAILLAYLPWF